MLASSLFSTNLPRAVEYFGRDLAQGLADGYLLVETRGPGHTPKLTCRARSACPTGK
ncbi:hypothetical protein [Amycolatopsis rubida]|uniref:hypothetical protein n=1 Tax=Amycolatopsis rubida TaxID=112413 RepID=UPI001FCBF832|nr:hypothetical protein [Amycolatopsis rubida]